MADKIVDYDEYCHKCQHFNFVDWDYPCNDCLNTPVNTDSHKPLYFKETEYEAKKRAKRSSRKDA